MLYTMRTGIDRQVKDKVANSILYGTGVVVAGFLAIAPFTGNNTFWNGGSNGQGSNSSNSNGTPTSSKSLNVTASSAKDTKSTGSATTSPVGATIAPQSTVGQTASSATATGSSVTAPALSTPGVVGRGGGGTTDPKTTTSPSSDPLPVETNPVNPTPTPALPVTVCTPTTSLDPLLTANPACVN